jgi:hypothetical protein
MKSLEKAVNSELEPDERDHVKTMVIEVVDEADEIPIMVTTVKNNGQYHMNIAHPQEPEPFSS